MEHRAEEGNSLLTLYGHIKTAEQRNGDWYTGR